MNKKLVGHAFPRMRVGRVWVYDLTGARFGRLIAGERVPSSDNVSWWSCRCDCGKACRVRANTLLRKNATRSCGCLHEETLASGKNGRTHGRSRTPAHISWQSMLTRCGNPNARSFSKYGALGIRVCERWATSFEAFLLDMGERPAGTSIDRIDPRGGYEPGNCRWATMLEQGTNKRRHVLVEHEGRTQTVSQWAREFSVSPYGIYPRIRRGIPFAEALRLARPPRPRRRREVS